MACITPRIPSHLSFFASNSSRSLFLIPSRSINSTCRINASANAKPKISSGSNERTVIDALELQLLRPHSRWSLTPDHEGIQRRFRFKTFKAAWSFMNRVAGECKTARHHPEWANVYNTVFVRWTTHEPRGLSEKDITMAIFCDEHARELGEVVLEDSEAEGTEMGDGLDGLVEGIGKEAGDCCVPKKEKEK